MTELFPKPATQESSARYETSQAEYVHDLREHAVAIPDLTRLRSGHILSPRESVLLGQYASSHYSQEVQQQGIAPLFREDIIDPHFCGSVDELTRKLAGSGSYHWYVAEWSGGERPFGNSPAARAVSQRWEVAFVDYMRQRRLFHAAFMQSLISKEPVAPLVDAIPIEARVPPTNTFDFDDQPAPDFMYNRTNWLASSLLSALALPPELCSADMKRHAIEQWAQHADLNDEKATHDFYGLQKLWRPVQLPWSMRSNADLSDHYHPRWRENRIIKGYLGESWQPHPDGPETLLQERPKDYIQVLILKTLGNLGGPQEGLRLLAQAAGLAPEVKDIIFATDAAHNTIFSDSPVLPEYGQPTTLLKHLEAQGGEISGATQESIIEGQRLRIQALEDRLATSEEDRGALQERLRQLGAIVTQMQPHLPRSQGDLAMLRYGISPAISNELLEAAVRGIRHQQNRKLRSDTSADPEQLEELQRINADLDDILRSRGLGKNTETS